MAHKTLADSQADNFEKLYVGNEDLRDLFANLVASEELPKGILIIHGVGGVGKSSLLRMYRSHCKRTHVPIAITSADEAESAVEVLSNWASDLKVDGIALKTFQKTLLDYRTIQANVEVQVIQARKSQRKAAEKAGRVIVNAVGAVVNLIPGGQMVNVLGGIGADALVDWLSGFLSKPDIDLLLDPVKVLTRDFLKDIDKVAQKRRLVLVLDTFEQMSALSDWVCDTVKQLNSNILIVVAGREIVDWDRRWSGWLAYAQVVELKPMNDVDMHELAYRYYATTARGEPDPEQIKAIVAFARGLPMVVATAVRLWVKYGQEFDIEAHKVEVYGDVINRLRDGIPAELIPVLEAASVVRWFNEAILCALTKQTDVKAAYNELSKFPFVKSSKDGLTLHESVREILEEDIRVDKFEYYKDLHERAEIYFKDEAEHASSEEERSRLGIEWLYHAVRDDEKSGLQEYQNAAEFLLGMRQKDKLHLLLHDLESYFLGSGASPSWLMYFKARLDDLDKDEVDSSWGQVVVHKISFIETPIKEPINKKTYKFSDSEKPLKVFLCHGKEDKPQVRVLYKRLKEIGIQPWFDEEDLKGGQDWELEIIMAVQESDAVIACLSSKSVRKTGFIQKEIKMALDATDERPEGKIFLIPARLDECEMPIRLQSKQWVDLFQTNGFEKLVLALEELL